jgi:hypothetical protein
LRYVTILQDYLEKKLTNNGPLIPSATKHSIYTMNILQHKDLWVYHAYWGVKMRPIIAAVLALFLSIHLSFARIVDPHEVPNAILDSLAEELDKFAIDVRRGSPLTVSFDAVRPQLAQLSSFPIPDRFHYQALSGFRRLFEAGVYTEAYLVAVDTGQPREAETASEFRATWEATPEEKRVFVSFSGKDIQYAEQVRLALQTKGYTTFIFKSGLSLYPETNVVEVGRYFREAGHHLVIDTEAARSSFGVITEALTLRAMTRGDTYIPPITRIFPPYSHSDDAPPPQKEPPTSSNVTPCCHRCTYIDGVLVGCEPPECGPQCRNVTKRPFSLEVPYNR